MVLFNYATKELTAKIVYYGPGLCGKTTNLQWIHTKVPIKNKGKMLSLATETDRTLFFDFLPIELGTIRGMRTRMQLYTVPGQVFYNATRRMVLKGADCVVFVADSQEPMLDTNLESLENLRQNLIANELDPDRLPLLFQFNKRDLPNALPVEILNERLNPNGLPFHEAVAIKGHGVEDTLKSATALVFKSLSAKYGAASASPVGDVTPAPTTEATPPSKPEPVAAGPIPTAPPRRPPPLAPVAPAPPRPKERQTIPPAAALRTIPPPPLPEEEIPEELLESLDEEPPVFPERRPRPAALPAQRPAPATAEVAVRRAPAEPAARIEPVRSLDDLNPSQTVAHDGLAVEELRSQLRATPTPEMTLEEVADEEDIEETFGPDLTETPGLHPSPIEPLAPSTARVTVPVVGAAGDAQKSAEVTVPVNVDLSGDEAIVRIHLVLNLTIKK